MSIGNIHVFIRGHILCKKIKGSEELLLRVS